MRPENPSDPPVRLLETRVGPVGITDVGQGPLVLAVHGLPGSNRDYRWLGPVLEPEVRFVRVDLPGFGTSPLETLPDRSLASRGGLLTDVLDALGVERAMVVGHSFGGAVATAVASRAPERTSHLVLLASVGLTPHRGIREFSGWRGISLGLRVPILRRFVLSRVRDGYHRAGFPRSMEDRAYVQSIHDLVASPISEHAANVRALTVPTLVAWTEDDPLVEAPISEALADACPAGPRLVFEQGGHNLQKTHAREVGRALLDFLAKTT